MNGSLEKGKENFEKVKLIGALCNNAPSPKEGDRETGDPIEIALNHLVNASDANIEELKKEYERIDEVPFSSELKMMGTLHKGPQTVGRY